MQAKKPQISLPVRSQTYGQRPFAHVQRRQNSIKPYHYIASNKAVQQTNKGAALILPGFLFSAKPYHGLRSLLEQRGYATEIVPLTTSMWLPVLFLGSSFEFYLDAMDEALQRLFFQHGRVSLIGHSAGGWVARLLLGDVPYQGKVYGRRNMVRSLVTLGTPHGSIENYPLGKATEKLLLPDSTAPEEVAGSSLQFCNYYYPDVASLGGDSPLDVTCIAGNAVTGITFPEAFQRIKSGNQNGKNPSPIENASLSNTLEINIMSRDGISNKGSPWDAYFAYESYKSGCGEGAVAGDAVTPICISHLVGARNIVLEGVWHSPRRQEGQYWYGDEPILDQWERFLLPSGAEKIGERR